MQHEAQLLRGKMSEVQMDIAAVERETGACMENIEQLDRKKTELQFAKQGLLESDGWGRLTAEFEDFLERVDVTNARDKLRAMQRSLAAQRGLDGQSEREAQLEGFKNRMEALISPAVVQSLSTNDIEKSRKHVETFEIMERLPQLKQYYRTVQKKAMQQQWAEMVELSAQSNSTMFLQEFYDFLIENWHKQQRWCSAVFGPPTDEATTVLCELLSSSLQPTREVAVSNCIKRNSNEKLAVLQEISLANVQFGRTMLLAIGDTASIELRTTMSEAVYNWFEQFIAQYAALEQNYLAQKLADLPLQHGQTVETIRALGNANAKVFEWCEEAESRCAAITENCGLAPMVIVLNVCFFFGFKLLINSFLYIFNFKMNRTFSKHSWRNIEKLNSNCTPANRSNKTGVSSKLVLHCCRTLAISPPNF